ncbi:exonuclease GOR-like [Limulus polyphemus]|uniref:Exonuclease GOR-like n=1 Tax=Limulus polyphemus TaxID=6850 RepID=A0ABM1BQ52_LIMPO|nr:exonuclease GOR-like [Limulus polyphemus]
MKTKYGLAIGCLLQLPYSLRKPSYYRINSMAMWIEALRENSEIALVTSVISSVILVISAVFIFSRYEHNEDPQNIQDSDCNSKEKKPGNHQTNKKKKSLSNKRHNMKAQYTPSWLLSTVKGRSRDILDINLSCNGKYLPPYEKGINSPENQEKCQNEKEEFPQARTKKSRHNNTLKNPQKRHPSNRVVNQPHRQPKHMNNKLLSPLQIYQKIKIDEVELYHQLYSYILSKEEQRYYGFPVDLSNDSGKLIIPNDYITPFKNYIVDPTERVCCRCRAKFYITEEGEYHANEECEYHFGKKQISFNCGIRQETYSCCGRHVGTHGCNKSKFHVSVQNHDTVDGFLKTRFKNKMGNSGIYALDCEMCFTFKGLEVTKVSVVGVDGLTVYDSLVLPENPIIDYNTHFSGITASDMLNVHTSLADVRAVLLKLLDSRTILIGHGLENDLKALKLIHETVIDTSILFPHCYGLPFRRSLKSLIKSYLKRSIQENGHDSVEDARACMELILWKTQKDSQA